MKNFIKQFIHADLASIPSFFSVLVMLCCVSQSGFAQSGPPVVVTDLQGSYTAIAGQPLVLSASFSGDMPMTNQWTFNGQALRDGGRISGSATSTLTISPVLVSDSGNYQLLVANDGGNNASTQAAVTVSPDLGFNGYGTDWSLNGIDGLGSFPANNTLELTDGSANTWEAVSGFYNNPVYVGAFQASFTYTDVGGGGADGACFVVQNDPRGASANGFVAGYLGYGVPSIGAGYFITNSVALEFNVYSSDTVGINFGENGSVPSSFYSTSPVNLASGDPINVSVSYSGGVFGVFLQDAINTNETWSTSAPLNIPSVIGTNMGYVGFTGGDSSDTSVQTISNFLFVSLAPNMPPNFVVAPTNLTIFLGQTAEFSASASSAASLGYQWQLNGVNLTNGRSPSGTGAIISGATSSNLTITGATVADSGEGYTVVATNSYGTNSAPSAGPAYLTVLAGPPAVVVDLQGSYAFTVGSPVTLSASFSGSIPMTNQWTFNGKSLTNSARISGVTSDVLTINPVLASDSGIYQLLVTNASGNSASSQTEVTVSPDLGFNGYGTGWSLNEANGTGLGSFIANNTLVLTDGSANQWEAVSSFYNSPVYVGAFQASFTYEDVGGGGADGTCFVVQNDPRGTSAVGWVAGYLGYGVPSAPPYVSNSVALEFNIYAPYTVGINFGENGSVPSSFYSTSPVNLASGDPINVSVSYSGGVFSVFLQDANKTNETWSTSAPLNIPSVIGTNVAYVGFTAGDSSDTSVQAVANFQFASLPPTASPSFMVAPTNLTIFLGQTAVFNAAAYSATPLGYQWQLNGINLTNGRSPSGTGAIISGVTSSNLTITGATVADSGEGYTVVATNSYGTSSAPSTGPAYLTVVAGPPAVVVDVQLSYTVSVGEPVTLSAGFSGTVPITNQWTFNGKSLTNSARISGVTSNVLTISSAQMSDAGTYQLLASNAYGNSASSQAVLTVSPYLSFNGYGTGWKLNGANGGSVSFNTNNIMVLTDGSADPWEAVSSFFNSPVNVDAFQASFTYEDVGGGGADGTCFVVQNDPRGTSAVGWVAGYLGYGVPSAPPYVSNSVALEFNIYAPYTVGINFGVNGTVPASFYSTAPVDLSSGDPINVSITYSGGVFSVFLQDANYTNETWSTSTPLNIPSVIGTNVAYVGFTAGDSSVTSVQAVANFQFASLVNLAAQAAGNKVVLAWSSTAAGSYQLQSNTNLANANDWVNVTNSVSVTNNQNQVTVPATGSAFYRLVIP